jgi:hypothetical protein
MNMKSVVFFILLFIPISAIGVSDDIQLQILNARIEKMETERAAKYEQLKKCEKETKGFKIAGIVTGATAVAGIATNIALNAKLKSMSATRGGGGEIRGADMRPASEKCADELDLYCPPDGTDIQLCERIKTEGCE